MFVCVCTLNSICFRYYKTKCKTEKNYIKKMFCNNTSQIIIVITGTLQVNLHVNWGVYSHDDRFWMWLESDSSRERRWNQIKGVFIVFIKFLFVSTYYRCICLNTRLGSYIRFREKVSPRGVQGFVSQV